MGILQILRGENSFDHFRQLDCWFFKKNWWKLRATAVFQGDAFFFSVFSLFVGVVLSISVLFVGKIRKTPMLNYALFVVGHLKGFKDSPILRFAWLRLHLQSFLPERSSFFCRECSLTICTVSPVSVFFESLWGKSRKTSWEKSELQHTAISYAHARQCTFPTMNPESESLKKACW